MKKILNITGVKSINKASQKSILGGRGRGGGSCFRNCRSILPDSGQICCNQCNTDESYC